MELKSGNKEGCAQGMWGVKKRLAMGGGTKAPRSQKKAEMKKKKKGCVPAKKGMSAGGDGC